MSAAVGKIVLSMAPMPIPKEPIIFNKVTSCICGPNDDTITPRESGKLDYEVELGIVIGKRARYLAKDKAKDAIAGYFLSNDVSERVFQIERSGGQWDKGKGCETFGPIGPWFVTKDEIKDPQNLDMLSEYARPRGRRRIQRQHPLRTGRGAQWPGASAGPGNARGYSCSI